MVILADHDRASAAEAFVERCLDVAWGLKMRQRVVTDDYDVNACRPQRQSAEVGNDTAERKVTRGSFTLGSIDGSVREIGTCHPEPEREESKRLRADANRSVEHRARARPPMFADERRQRRPLPGDTCLPVLIDEMVQRSQLTVKRLDRHAIPCGLTIFLHPTGLSSNHYI